MYRAGVVFIVAGKDATEDFEEIGHSNAAKDLLSKYIIGDFEVSPSQSAGWWPLSYCLGYIGGKERLD